MVELRLTCYYSEIETVHILLCIKTNDNEEGDHSPGIIKFLNISQTLQHFTHIVCVTHVKHVLLSVLPAHCYMSVQKRSRFSNQQILKQAIQGSLQSLLNTGVASNLNSTINNILWQDFVHETPPTVGY